MNESKPMVSICCITYNQVDYICDAIEGFLMQKTTFPFEILIHDDASTDGTAEIVKNYAEKNPDLIFPIFQKENQYSKGKKPNPEFNYPRARGKYIALCEGDDYWIDPKKLQRQIECLEAKPNCVLCFHNAVVRYDNKYKLPHLFSDLDNAEYGIKDVIEKQWFIPTASIVFKKEGLVMPNWTRFVFGGDFALQLTLITKGNFFCINEPMSVYRKNNNGISINKSPTFHATKLIESLCYFNAYTDFRFQHHIQNRINLIRENLYKNILIGLPFWRKILSKDYYLYSLQNSLQTFFAGHGYSAKMKKGEFQKISSTIFSNLRRKN